MRSPGWDCFASLGYFPLGSAGVVGSDICFSGLGILLGSSRRYSGYRQRGQKTKDVLLDRGIVESIGRRSQDPIEIELLVGDVRQRFNAPPVPTSSPLT